MNSVYLWGCVMLYIIICIDGMHGIYISYDSHTVYSCLWWCHCVSLFSLAGSEFLSKVDNFCFTTRSGSNHVCTSLRGCYISPRVTSPRAPLRTYPSDLPWCIQLCGDICGGIWICRCEPHRWCYAFLTCGCGEDILYVTWKKFGVKPIEGEWERWWNI